MSGEESSGNGTGDSAFSASYDHEKKRGECRIGKEPNALIAGISLVAMACVTVIAGIGLSKIKE